MQLDLSREFPCVRSLFLFSFFNFLVELFLFVGERFDFQPVCRVNSNTRQLSAKTGKRAGLTKVAEFKHFPVLLESNFNALYLFGYKPVAKNETIVEIN